MSTRESVRHLTYDVYCHVCEHAVCKVPRNQARLIGSPDFGGLWHCVTHEDVDCGCPRGSWTEAKVSES